MATIMSKKLVSCSVELLNGFKVSISISERFQAFLGRQKVLHAMGLREEWLRFTLRKFAPCLRRCCCGGCPDAIKSGAVFSEPQLAR